LLEELKTAFLKTSTYSW